MRFRGLFFCILVTVKSFVSGFYAPSPGDVTPKGLQLTKNPIQEKILKCKEMIQKKGGGFLRLIRYQSILPTTLLSFTGGRLLAPSFTHLLHSPSFIVATVNTLLIMSGSMVINDIFDVEIDKINHPHRPLITGDITKTEAILIATTLFGLSQYLSCRFLAPGLQLLVFVSMITTIAYTPIFKRLPFVKNAVCATLVSLSFFLGGVAGAVEYIPAAANFGSFSLTMSAIFGGSLYNELLLDIRDSLGDSKNGIYTIPVLFGKTVSWVVAGMVLYSNVVLNTLALGYLYPLPLAFGMPILFLPVFLHFYKIRKEGFSKESIQEALGKTTPVLAFFLAYVLWLSTNVPV
jgi:4-hydroxybenzoate polyprenyltransferase